MSRRMARGALLVVVAGVGLLGPATPASAYTDNYTCGVLAPNWLTECRSRGLHSWDYNEAYYPGPWAHNIEVCAYVWNNRTARIRGGIIACGNNTTNPRVYYGATIEADYNARVFEGNEANPHTVNGYAIA